MNIKLTTFPLTVLSTLLIVPITVAAADNETGRELVVTASGFKQSIQEAPASITVISREALEQGKFNQLADALRDVEGVDVFANTGKTGGLNISIRGMPAEYTLVLIDGQRQNNTSNITPNGFNETSNSFFPPLAAIERIEVIRGPMSTLYGSDAIGGVVNIITKKIPTIWSTSVTLDQTVPENRQLGGVSNGSFYTAGSLADGKLGLMLKGRVLHRQASHLRAKNNGNLVISERGPSPVKGDIYNLGGRIAVKLDEKQRVWFEVDHSSQQYDNRYSQLGNRDTAARAFGYQDTLRFNRSQTLLGHNFKDDIADITSILSFRDTNTKGRSIPSDAARQLKLRAGSDRQLREQEWLASSKLIMPLGDLHKLSTGVEFRHSKLNEGLIADKLTQNLLAIFMEDDWRFHPALQATLGLRYDHHRAFGSHFSPRSYLIWNALPHLKIKGGVSQGYKTPSLERLYNGVNGVTRQGRVFTLGNSNLKPEVSTNYELSVYYDNQAGNTANITYFHNDFKQKILSQTVGNCAVLATPNCVNLPNIPRSVTEFSQPFNVDRALIQGVELSGETYLAHNWRLNLNYTYTKTKQKSGVDAGMPLTYIPKHMAYAKISWAVNPYITTWINGEYRRGAPRFLQSYDRLSARDRAESDLMGDKLHSSMVYNMGASYHLNENITLNAVIYNLLNKNFMDYQIVNYANGNNIESAYANKYIRSAAATSGYLQPSRQFWLALDITF